MQLCLRPSSCSDKFGDGSVQSTTENFMPSYSLHTALCLMYQLWTAQPKTGRKANCDALHVSMCMSVCVFLGGGTWIVPRTAAESEPDRRLITVSAFITTTWPLTTVFLQTRGEKHCRASVVTLNFGRTFFFFFLLFMLQIMLHMSSNYFWKCEITYVYWAKNSPTEINITSAAMQQTNPSKTNRFLNLHEKQAN